MAMQSQEIESLVTSVVCYQWYSQQNRKQTLLGVFIASPLYLLVFIQS
jgi:hypothetical protein